MGRMQSLTVLALGRSPYEQDLIQDFDSQESQELGDQEYDESGRPINRWSERIARDQVRAANEVLETAGIIEEYSTVKKREAKARKLKEEESRAGLSLLDYGRYSLQMGTWGNVGLRRRIMLFQPYSTMRFIEILRYERSHSSNFHILFAGLPASIIHAMISFTENVLYRLGRRKLHNRLQGSQSNVKLKYRIEKNVAYGIYALQRYVGLHVRLFTLLQQLDLVSARRWFPSLKSLVPMSTTSPIQLPSLPSVMSIMTMQSWMSATALSLAPIISVYLFDKISTKVTKRLLLPLYNQMPKPISEDPNWARKVEIMWHGYDSKAMHPIEPQEERPASQHDQTLRILEGLPAEDENEADDEIVHATLVSFDVEASEMEATGNAYSAELRNMNAEPEPTAFRTNFLTTLPPIFSTEIFAKILGGIALVPLETIMIRVVADGFTRSAGIKMDVWEMPGSWRWVRNILATHAIDLLVGGVLWWGVSGVSYFIRVGEIEED